MVYKNLCIKAKAIVISRLEQIKNRFFFIKELQLKGLG